MKIDATDISMGNAAAIVAAGVTAIRSGDPSIDLSAVKTCDSSAVAAVLAWQREAARAGHSLRLIGTPADLLSLASVYGVESLIATSDWQRRRGRATYNQSFLAAPRTGALPVVIAIQVSQVTKRYGALAALAGVDLAIAEGEFFGLLGPNGAGKTTLISIIAGLVRASSGRVAVMGHDVVDDYRPARLALGVVPQELAFDPFFTVRETLTFQSGYFGLKGNDDWIDEVLANLGLTAKANVNMRALSGGMKRRVLVAQALVHKPPVIVLDEPTAGVDVELRQTLWAFIRRLNQEGHTIVLTTHYLEEAQALCERIAMLKDGQVIALDTTRALLARFAGLQMTLRATGPLPSFVMSHRIDERDGAVLLRLAQPSDVARVIGECQAAGCAIEDLEVGHADLEDVFLQLMSEGRTAERAAA